MERSFGSPHNSWLKHLRRWFGYNSIFRASLFRGMAEESWNTKNQLSSEEHLLILYFIICHLIETLSGAVQRDKFALSKPKTNLASKLL